MEFSPEFQPTLSDTEVGEGRTDYPVGLYADRAEIPEGGWGYVADADHPRGFYGPIYNDAGQERPTTHELWSQFDDLVRSGSYHPRLAEFLETAKDKDSVSRYISIARDF